MKFRTWLNIFTFVFLVLVIYLAKDQIFSAWQLLGKVNIFIFLLMLPIQIISYYATGEVMFSYLRTKGNLGEMSKWGMTRTALELNFVNHIIPVPSIAGFSYLGWVLSRHGVSVGRATMAQIIRYVTMFISFVFLILLSVLFITLDQGVSRVVIVISFLFAITTIAITALLMYAIGNKKRLKNISTLVTNISNKTISFFTFGKKINALKKDRVELFFYDLHNDYIEIRGDIKILKSPLMWATFSNILDVALIYIAFLSFGYIINPATLFIAYGISSFAAIFTATPGGSGAYEAIMITYLVSAGVSANAAIAGTLLARVTLMISTILFGYIFYQLTINKYGKYKK